jgi:hypothetical protein
VNVWPAVALTVFVVPVITPNGSFVPVPVANLAASRTSFASESRAPSSACSVVQSCPTSMLNGTHACAFSVLIVGCARVGALSVVSVASAAYAAVTPAELTPRH